MLGNPAISWAEQINWVWSNIVNIHPEFKRELFPKYIDDPYALHEIIVNNCYRYSGAPNTKVMDIGANKGIFTALCALNGSIVTAYEALPQVYDILCDMIDKVGIKDRVTPINTAIWTHVGQVGCEGGGGRIGDASWESFNSTVARGDINIGTPINCISLDDAIGNQEWDCVKLDIEGAEFDVVLAASDSTLQRIKFFSLELHNGWVDKEKYDKFIVHLKRIFLIEGNLDGNPEVAGQDRFISIYGTRK